jgi:hypothetical protein
MVNIVASWQLTRSRTLTDSATVVEVKKLWQDFPAI